jgi:hypothetical protein
VGDPPLPALDVPAAPLPPAPVAGSSSELEQARAIPAAAQLSATRRALAVLERSAREEKERTRAKIEDERIPSA